MGKKKKQKSSKNTRWVILRHPVVLILLWGLIKLPFDLYQKYTVYKNGIEVTATVYKTTKQGGRRTLYFMYYEYQAGRKWYKPRKTMMGKNEYSKGDTVRIKYLPKDPEVNFIVKELDDNMNGLKKLLPFLDWD